MGTRRVVAIFIATDLNRTELNRTEPQTTLITCFYFKLWSVKEKGAYSVVYKNHPMRLKIGCITIVHENQPLNVEGMVINVINVICLIHSSSLLL